MAEQVDNQECLLSNEASMIVSSLTAWQCIHIAYEIVGIDFMLTITVESSDNMVKCNIAYRPW